MEHFRSVHDDIHKWASKDVFNQISNCYKKKYMCIDVEKDTGEVILYGNEKHFEKLDKLMKKIISERTFEDEKKQYAIRKVCYDIIELIR